MKHLYLLVLLVMPLSSLAQQIQTLSPSAQVPLVPGTMSADRPGFGFSTDIAAPGVRQMESGFAFGITKQTTARQRAFAFGSPLLRLGISRHIELRLGGQSFTTQQIEISGTTRSERGWSDFGIGSKFALVHQSRLEPAISGLVSVTMPTGAKAFTSGGYDSSVALGWSKNLPDAINLGGASGVAWVSDRGSHHDELSHSVSLSRGLAHGLTPYAEVAYDHSRTLSGDSPWMVDGGSSRNVGSNVQVDAEYGRGLASQQSQAWIVSAGCSFRAAGRVRH